MTMSSSQGARQRARATPTGCCAAHCVTCGSCGCAPAAAGRSAAMISSNRTSDMIARSGVAALAVMLWVCAHAATVDELEARFESSACPPAADPAHRAALELPALRRRVEATQEPPASWLDELARAYELVEDYGASQQVLERVLARRERVADGIEVL